MKRIALFAPVFALIGILIFAWITRLYRLQFPAEYVFDERYHVPAVRLIAENDRRAFEWWHGPIYGSDNHDWLHPPLAKYIQAWFFENFGQDVYSWRLASAVFGVIGIGLVFVVTQLAFRKTVISLLAALLLSLDGAWLVQSRVAMNDVFVSVWLLAATAAYLWCKRQGRPEWLLLVGGFAGLGVATKWSAVFWVGGLIIWELLGLLRAKAWRKLPWLIFSLIVVPAAIYIASFARLFIEGKSLSYFMELHTNIVQYEFLRGGSHAYQSTPWQWFLNLIPVWYWHGSGQRDIILFGNPILSWLEVGAVFFVVGILARVKEKKWLDNLDFLLMIFLTSFLPWLASPRLLFYYHYTPAAPIAAILLAYWLHDMYLRRSGRHLRAAFFLLLSCIVWAFWLYYPRWTGLPVAEGFSQAVYSVFPQL